MQILAQEDEFAALKALFDSEKSKFRWIPGFSDGFCVFSAAWMALEATLFETSPFFCGLGMEGDNMDWRGSEKFLQFVAGSAREVQFLTMCTDDERTVWREIELTPKSCPRHRSKYSIASACQGIVQFLSKKFQTGLSIWEKHAEGGLFCSRAFGQQEESADGSLVSMSQTGLSIWKHSDDTQPHCSGIETTMINILLWNQMCPQPHFDLLLLSPRMDLMEDEH